MPLTDKFGQNISIATLTDKPNAQTLAEGLAGMVGQTVMRFPSASVRGATITQPVEGMVTWLKDVNRLEVYDGAAWSVITAGTSAWTTVSLRSGFSHNGNNQGDFQYRVINLFGEMGLMFRGGLSVTYVNGAIANQLINFGALPVHARPSTLRTLVIPCSDVSSERITLKLDVQTDGYLKLYGTQAGTTPPWIGFNGVFCSL